ncbi:MAG: putative porin, partial [Bacteroidota bacterium]
MRYLPLLLLAFCGQILLAQEDSIPPPPSPNDSLPQSSMGTKSLPSAPTEITIKDYKIITHSRDTTYLDTTLTIQKEYRYNYIRRDDFELMPFANVGQPYNKLGVNFERINPFPRLGATARHFNYLEVEDIQYYNVATPMTDLFFKTTFEQGQLLDAKLTFNTSRRLNFSIAYKGFRSLGKYQFNQVESGNFRTTFNYLTRNGRYSIRGHIAAQDIDTEENGGLFDKELQFESEDPEFQDRSRIDVVLTDATSKILGKRYYFEHQYKLLRKVKDSTQKELTALAIGHQFNYETKFYQFMQTSQNDFFGDENNVILTPINDKASLKTMYNEFSTTFSNSLLGELKGFAGLYNYNYFFDSILLTGDGQRIDNQLEGEEIMVGAAYTKKIGDFLVKGKGAYTVSGELTSSILDASAGYVINDKHHITASIHSSTRLPDFNYLLYQSEYQNYNWQNNTIFDNQSVNSLQLNLKSELWGNF